MTFAILTFSGLLAAGVSTGKLLASGKPSNLLGVLFGAALIGAGVLSLIT